MMINDVWRKIWSRLRPVVRVPVRVLRRGVRIWRSRIGPQRHVPVDPLDMFEQGKGPISAAELAYLQRLISALSRRFPTNEAYPVFYSLGYHLLRRHYYLPIPEQEEMDYVTDSDLVGIDIHDEAAFSFLENVLRPYKAEFNAFPVHKTPDLNPHQYYLINGSYMAVDGNVYYALIRHYKPRQVIEIGSGNSTLLAAAAIRKNLSEGHPPTELVCIEPYPSDVLRELPEISQLVQRKVQEVDLSLFTSLRANDILFIDSTHVLRPGGDVWWEYCEILPRLAPGVLVHIHDVSLPRPYPSPYLDYHWYWTEQYVLQAFLTYNARVEVVWPGNYLMTKYPEEMQQAFAPEYGLMREQFPFSEPSSFWMRVLAAS